VLPALVERAGGAPRGVSLERSCALVRGVVGRWGGLVVDVETTGYPVGHRWCGLRTVQLGDEHVAVVFDATDPQQAAAVRVLLAGAPRLVAHSAVADLVPLAHAGLLDWGSAWERVVDTVLLARLADPSRSSTACGLKQLAAEVLGGEAVSPGADRARAEVFTRAGWVTSTQVGTPVRASGWAQVDPGWLTMVRYAAADVLDTAALAERLPACEPGLLARERSVQAMVARLSLVGLRLEPLWVQALLEEHTRAREQARERVRGFGVADHRGLRLQRREPPMDGRADSLERPDLPGQLGLGGHRPVDRDWS
jgi:hypothetical protein